MITSENTVGEVAVSFPSTSRVFEQHHIDYCCGAYRSIADACAEQNIAVDDLISQLRRVSQEAPPPDVQDWTKTSLTKLIDYILETHHQYLYDEVPRLDQMLSKVIDAHGNRHPESLIPLGGVFNSFEREIEDHLLKEERVLFPLIKEMETAQERGTSLPEFGCGSVNNPVRVMRYEHDNAGNALLEIRRLTDNHTPPEDACNTYRILFHGLLELEQDLHQHIHLENNILFPRVIALEDALNNRCSI